MNERALRVITDLIHGQLEKVIEGHYPTTGVSPEAQEFNLAMKRGSNLMKGIWTQEKAAVHQREVNSAVDLFRDAQKVRPNDWNAINSEAKCLYLLEDYDGSQRRNLVAKANIRTGLSNSEEDQAKVEGRFASHHNLEVMVGIATKQYDLAIHHCIEGLSYSPDNLHLRMGYLRALVLSNDMSGSLKQIEQMESNKDFATWALEFASRIENDLDFLNLREHPTWPKTKLRWNELTQKYLLESKEKVQKNSTRKTQARKLMRYAALIGIGIGLDPIVEVFGDILGLEEMTESAVTEDAGEETDEVITVGDIEPFGLESQGFEVLLADIEPFTVSPSNVNPWLGDILIG